MGSEGAGLLAIVLLLSSQLPQPKFLPFRDRGLRHQATKDDLAGSIEPVAGQRVDNLTPNPLLERVEIRRRLRTTTPREHRHNAKRSSGFARHRAHISTTPKIMHVSAARPRRWSGIAAL
jgi:BioD-like phosphotransacetylase family protein